MGERENSFVAQINVEQAGVKLGLAREFLSRFQGACRANNDTAERRYYRLKLEGH